MTERQISQASLDALLAAAAYEPPALEDDPAWALIKQHLPEDYTREEDNA